MASKPSPFAIANDGPALVVTHPPSRKLEIQLAVNAALLLLTPVGSIFFSGWIAGNPPLLMVYMLAGLIGMFMWPFTNMSLDKRWSEAGVLARIGRSPLRIEPPSAGAHYRDETTTASVTWDDRTVDASRIREVQLRAARFFEAYLVLDDEAVLVAQSADQTIAARLVERLREALHMSPAEVPPVKLELPTTRGALLPLVLRWCVVGPIYEALCLVPGEEPWRLWPVALVGVAVFVAANALLSRRSVQRQRRILKKWLSEQFPGSG